MTHALLSLEPQELKRQLEAPGCASAVRASVLATIAAASEAFSPADVEPDMRAVLCLVLLVGRLDDGDPSLRCAATELLAGAHACAAACCCACTALTSDQGRRCSWVCCTPCTSNKLTTHVS